jgi:hypothetical protein
MGVMLALYGVMAVAVGFAAGYGLALVMHGPEWRTVRVRCPCSCIFEASAAVAPKNRNQCPKCGAAVTYQA